MTDFSVFQATMRDHRIAAGAAADDLVQARWALTTAEQQLLAARSGADAAAVSAAEQQRAEAERRAADAAAALVVANDRVDGGINDVIAAQQPADVIAGVDNGLPITLLPVRIETRFATENGPVLRVRIYPDDLHIDDHEPALSPDEVDAGRAYWTAVRGGRAEAEVWPALAARCGPYRAVWVRGALEPTGPPDALVFPDVAQRAPGTSRPAVARALPDLFVVRVRIAGAAPIFTPGSPVADNLQVGVDLSTTAASTSLSNGTLVLADAMAWMSDYAAAEQAGMAVTVPLPAATTSVDDVTVVGVRVSQTPEDTAELLGSLFAAHHVTHGAEFLLPGTPTNNLADTSSGFSSRPDPSRLDPSARPVAGAESNAGVVAAAVGIPIEHLAPLVGAADNQDLEARTIQRALFEATWGPYLRQQAQPGFPLRWMPLVYGHVTEYVRGDGPLPALRLGHQPYGILPIQPHGWTANAEDQFVRWLGGYLPRVRQLWLSGGAAAPSGLAMYTHEAVSTRVRVRSSNASSTQSFFDLYGIGDPNDSRVQERRLLAELGLGDAMPAVISQLFTKGPADLWMAMSVDGDVDFSLLDPQPKDATSVLGLLLRNAALQVTSSAADEYRAGMEANADVDVLGYAGRSRFVAAIDSAAGLAVSTTTSFLSGPATTFSEVVALQGRDTNGQQFQISDKLNELVDAQAVADVARYFNSDAVVAFNAARGDLRAIPTDRRARLTGEALDCASHRYDAWTTSLATHRLEQLRAARPTGTQLGAWGYVHGVRRRDQDPVGRADLPDGTVHDDANRGFVLAPSLRHANVAGVLRAAWVAHGGVTTDEDAPFAVSMTSSRYAVPSTWRPACATASSSAPCSATSWSATSTRRPAVPSSWTGRSSSCAVGSPCGSRRVRTPARRRSASSPMGGASPRPSSTTPAPSRRRSPRAGRPGCWPPRRPPCSWPSTGSWTPSTRSPTSVSPRPCTSSPGATSIGRRLPRT